MGYVLDVTSLLEIAMVGACDLPADMQGDITRLILAYPDEPLLTPVIENDVSNATTRDQS